MTPSNHDANIITKPTWYEHIYDFFTEEEILETKQQYSIHLGAYTDVQQNFKKIIQLAKNTENLDHPPIKPWNKNKLQSFKNWQNNGYTIGLPTPKMSLKKAPQLEKNQAVRIRKNLAELNDDDIKKLKKAFIEIQKRDTDPKSTNSYFAIAGMHWYPAHQDEQWNNIAAGLFCHHHIPRYNPWHRAYLYYFENALRSVEGCEDVTLPYWDFQNTETFPQLLNEYPFKSYKLPFTILEKKEGHSVAHPYRKGDETKRDPDEDILTNYKEDVVENITRAMKARTWEAFHVFTRGSNAIIGGHDSGHNSIGPTMSNQEISSFDPIFWFFHCNWDRLWWKWQKKMHATDLEGLKKTISTKNSKAIFERDLLKTLAPFSDLQTTDVVDSLNQLGIDYKDPIGEPVLEVAPLLLGSTTQKNAINFDIKNASIRVKAVNRLRIPGSFWIALNGKDKGSNDQPKKIKRLGFFQPSQVGLCENCVSNAIIDFDFIVPLDAIQGKELSIQITSVDKRQDFSHALEDVTINARLLAIQE